MTGLAELPIDSHGLRFRASPSLFSRQVELTYLLAEREQVHLTIHDISGRIVAVLVDRFEDRGSHTVIFDSESGFGGVLSSGQYFAKLQVGNQVSVAKLTKLH